MEEELEFEIVDIESVEQLEDFDDEYVYDIEVDGCHNVFGNGLLVHNSIYVEFGRITRQLGIQRPGPGVEGDPEAHFICDMWDKGVGPFMARCYDAYAKHYHTKVNKQVLELEKLARTTVLIAKKRYLMEESWKEPDIYLDKLEDINYKGIELVQGATPKKIKSYMKDFYEFILGWYYDHDEMPPYDMIQNKIKQYKAEFIIQKPDDICKTTSISDYKAYILEDKNELRYTSGAPIHVRAAALYNHTLYNNPKYLVKYEPIASGKVKWYYAKDSEPFAYIPGKFCAEFAPAIDYDTMFEKMLLEPLNRVITSIGHNPMLSTLTYVPPLW